MNVDEERYQHRLERAACLKLAMFEGLSCLIFFFLPNPSAFARLTANGFGFTPTLLAALNGAGALFYLWMRDDPAAREWRLPVRRMLFFLASVPLLAYLIPLGIILIATTGMITGISYVAIYVVILLVITAVFQGYSRRLEVVSLAGMALFMGFIGYTFATTTNATPVAIPFPDVVLAALALGGGLLYVLLMTPQARLVSQFARRTLFMLGEAVIPVYATILLVNAWLFAGSIYPPVAFYILYLLIALLPYGIFRTDDAPTPDPR